MKKNISLFLALTFLFGVMILPSSAVASEVQQETTIIHTDYGDVQVNDTLIISPSIQRSATVHADLIRTFTYDDEDIATVTLSADFGYNGLLSWVLSTDSSHTTSGGWTYKNETITTSTTSTSEGTVSLTAKLTKFLDSPILVDMSLTCSPSGGIR